MFAPKTEDVEETRPVSHSGGDSLNPTVDCLAPVDGRPLLWADDLNERGESVPRLRGSLAKRLELPRLVLDDGDVVAVAGRDWMEVGVPEPQLDWTSGHGRIFTLRVKDVKERPIEIRFSTRKLERACSTDREGAKRWGPENWRRLKRRLVSLMSAPTLQDMQGVPGGCHQLTADRAGEFALDLWGSYRLIFEPDHKPVARLPDGGVDRSKVTRIVIKEVTDYHGK